MVTGNSEKEIDKAIENAKARYKEIHDQVRNELGQQVKTNMSPTSPDTEALDEEELEKRISQIDKDKYLEDPEYRERILAQLEGSYQRAMGR